jgi:hypothetical protein
MELLPSLVMYPRIRQKQKSTPGLNRLTTSDGSHAFTGIRERTELIQSNEFDELSHI